MDNIEEFDNIIKKLAKEERILLPKGFEERNNNLIAKFHIGLVKEKKQVKFKISKAAVFLIVFLMCGITVTANSLTGGAFFTKFFSQVAGKDSAKDYSYMNTEQLSNLESSITGTVVGTDEITVDVLGIIKSGNTADVMLKVTANKLDSVLYDTKLDTLQNYRFNDEASGSLFDSTEKMTVSYIYSDEDKELEPNQFEILYTIIANNTFTEKKYTVELNNFGYFTHGSGGLTDFVSIYDENWKFEVSLDSTIDSYKVIYINKPIEVDDTNITVDNIKITPLACTINFSTDTEYSDEFFNEFSKGIGDITIELNDGTILDNSDFKYDSGAYEGTDILDSHLNFDVPITVDNVASISLFGIKFYME